MGIGLTLARSFAAVTGFEPAASALTGRRSNPAERYTASASLWNYRSFRAAILSTAALIDKASSLLLGWSIR